MNTLKKLPLSGPLFIVDLTISLPLAAKCGYPVEIALTNMDFFYHRHVVGNVSVSIKALVMNMHHECIYAPKMQQQLN